MPQINLLQQKNVSQSFGENLPKFLIGLFLLCFLGLLGYYGYLLKASAEVADNITKANDSISNSQAEAAKMQNAGELLTRQQQLKELDGLISGHVYWSQLLPEVAKVTLKTASYSDFKMAKDSTLTLTVTVPDLVAFDKFLQVFDLPKVNANFSDVGISSFSEAKDNSSQSVGFSVKMKYNTDILKYKASQAASAGSLQ